ncbi:PadR family transcriptional regulator [Lacisediminimonas sp.]|uniref:PadR family transcriptional regulator n=1 Tax=Lacisediminimonas sp. TaxID=3060582 RepID=UPI002723D154|nr:PadR family transcriptional regulator [Lacisediminimonas sp.]MDO8298264.1 PadR family transcriptional regulator [Lacisediminimonas sp.]
MSLKLAILGLLSLQPASGYDIKRTIDRSVYFIWNVTGPQIYTTLRTLREDGLIASESIPQVGKPAKQIHTITEQGKLALEALVNEPIQAAVTRDEVLLRVFFGNFADEATMLRELRAYLDRITSERLYMEKTEARVVARPGAREKERRFQLLSLHLKVAQYRVMEQELEMFLERESQMIKAEQADK